MTQGSLFYAGLDAEFFEVRQSAGGAGEQIKCPYCGESGVLNRRFDNGGVYVVHKTEWQTIRGVECCVLIDGCWQGQKCGERNEEFQ